MDGDISLTETAFDMLGFLVSHNFSSFRYGESPLTGQCRRGLLNVLVSLYIIGDNSYFFKYIFQFLHLRGFGGCVIITR